MSFPRQSIVYPLIKNEISALLARTVQNFGETNNIYCFALKENICIGSTLFLFLL